MLRPSSMPNLTAAAFFVLSLLSTAGASAADKGITQRVTRLEKQVATLSSQIATLQVEVANQAPLTMQVTCGNGETIQAALNLAGDRSARVTIDVSGYCPEDVALWRGNTVLRAVAPGDGFRSLAIEGAQGVRLEGLTLAGLVAASGASFAADGISIIDSPRIAVYITSGSTGELRSPVIRRCGGGTCVEVNGGSSLTIDQGLIEGTGTGMGVVAHGTSINLFDTVIRGHSRGIWVAGGTARMVGGAVEQNTSEGVATGGYMEAQGTAFRDNFWMGIAVMGGMFGMFGGEVTGNGTGVFSAGGVVTLRDGTVVRGNRFAGVSLENGSSLLLGETTIADNEGDGIWLGDVCVAIGVVTLTNNQGWGLRCETAPAVAQYRGTFNASGNAAGDILCPRP